MTSKTRIRFLGRHLMLKGIFIEKLLSGEKKATIRKGVYKPRYNEVIIHAGGRPVAKARITRVYYKKLRDLGEYEAKIEGFKTLDELLDSLRNMYGEIREDDYLTIIEFEVVQRLDNLPVEDKYYGLKPSDIARIALRYLSEELGELDRRILLDLTRTNSIRRTAINIFHDLNKRGIVRKTIRRALRALVEKGLLRLNTTRSNQLSRSHGGEEHGPLGTEM